MRFLKTTLLLVSLGLVLALSSCSTSGSSSKPSTPPSTPSATITAVSGTTQSLPAGTALPTKLQVSVMEGQTPVSGATVTFTAPASGASGIFASSGAPTETDTTNANGTATSSTFTANATAGTYSVSAAAVGATGTVNFNLTNLAPAAPAVITATSGSGQSSVDNTTFETPLVATVMQGQTPISGATVTFKAPAGGASGVFATSRTATETDTTNANGVATSSAFTANATSGAYSVSATAAGATGTANFSLTNTTAPLITLTPGNYVFSLAGKDANGSDYFVAGAFTIGVDGATITSGEQDFIDAFYEGFDPLTGSIAPSNDGTGNLLITLNTTPADVFIGPGAGNESGAGSGTETLVATLVSNSKAVIVESDSWATSRGTLDLQNSNAAAVTPSAGYVFAAAGLDAGGYPLAMGGVINIDGPGAISGAGSIFDANDAGSGSNFQGETLTANVSTVSSPDQFGRIEFSLTPTDTTDFSQIILAGYIVDATHIRLVEIYDNFQASLAGIALGQGTGNTGSFTSIAGNSYVVGLDGIDSIGVLQVAGLLTAGANTITGIVNFNDLTATGVQSPDPVSQATTTYVLDLTGRVSIPVITDGADEGANFSLQLYLDGNGNALAITLDTNDVLSGPAFQQNGGGSFTAGSFQGPYVMDAFGAYDSASQNGLNAVGPIKANGAGSFTGAVDINQITGTTPPLAGVQTSDSTVSGTFTAAASGVFFSATSTGSGITGLDVTTSNNQDAFAYYLIDTTRVLMIETDPNQLTLGYFLLQQ